MTHTTANAPEGWDDTFPEYPFLPCPDDLDGCGEAWAWIASRLVSLAPKSDGNTHLLPRETVCAILWGSTQCVTTMLSRVEKLGYRLPGYGDYEMSFSRPTCSESVLALSGIVSPEGGFHRQKSESKRQALNRLTNDISRQWQALHGLRYLLQFYCAVPSAPASLCASLHRITTTLTAVTHTTTESAKDLLCSIANEKSGAKAISSDTESTINRQSLALDTYNAKMAGGCAGMDALEETAQEVKEIFGLTRYGTKTCSNDMTSERRRRAEYAQLSEDFEILSE